MGCWLASIFWLLFGTRPILAEAPILQAMEDLTLIESLLSLPEVKVSSFEIKGRQILLHCSARSLNFKCPHCGDNEEKEVSRYYSRKIRDLNISGREVWLEVRVSQYHCQCGHYFQEPLSWVESGKSYTKRQAKFIFECCARQPFKEVAAIHNVGVQTVTRIYYTEANLVLNLAQRYKEVRYLGIDEIAHRKGRRNYCCVLVDLEKGRQLDILPDREKETLISHFKGLGTDFCAQIFEICTDMHGVYQEVAALCFPNARVTIDRFHVVQLLNKPLDRMRRKLKKAYPREEAYRRIKWLLFKQPKRLKDEQKQALKQAFALAPELHQAYQLRNQFHAILDQATSIEQAELYLGNWKRRVRKSHQEDWLPFLRTLKKWGNKILNFVESALTNAVTESLNNLIRYMKRISFGIPNFQHMRIRILATQ